MKKPSITWLLINLTAVFVIAFALSTFLHEGAHALTAKIVGVDPILFHSYVSYDTTDVLPIHQFYIVAAGPLFSLFQALFFLFALRSRNKLDMLKLFYLWVCIIGMVVFLGYLMMGPIAPYGDTGKIYEILNVPAFISVSLAILALFCVIFFFRKMTPRIAGFLFQLKTETGYGDQKVITTFLILPVLIGTVFNVLISLPAPTIMSLAFPIVIPLTIIPSTVRLYRSGLSAHMEQSDEILIAKKRYWPLLLLVLLLIISRVLAIGMAL